VAEDAEAVAARRSDPEVAELQSWEPPYPIERARDLVSEIVQREDPQPDEWWMLTIVGADDSKILGDIVFKLGWEGRSAEVGYTLARSAWGHGYATEALAALVERLFDGFDVSRIGAMLHPENSGSAMVLERTGFEFEGRTRLSYWIGDENTDDLIYGITREGWETWRTRPRTPPGHVDLIEVTSENAAAVNRLVTHQSQRKFVSPVTQSLADALVPPMVDGRLVEPWYRAIQAGDEIVGFVMLALANDVHVEPYLWRFVIDRLHQRRGIGASALESVIDQCRVWGADSLLVSWTPGRGSPAPLYLGRGFVATGKFEDGEIEARLVID
jgi:RimJ/RimL family protein N-acetyltransferase